MKKGTGMRIRVEGRSKLPGNWHQVLREDENKTELFNLLSEKVTTETSWCGGDDSKKRSTLLGGN